MDRKQLILDALGTMKKKEQIAKQTFKVRAYDKVIKQVNALPGPITDLEQLSGITGVGAAIKEKLEEIFATGRLMSAERAAAEVPIAAYDALLKVHGIGPAKARKLVEAGITSIAALREASAANPKLIDAASKIGLEHYESFLERIPRAEMEAHEAQIKSILPPNMSATLVGSYRRGAATSGDIDVLLTVDSANSKGQVKAFHDYVVALTTASYITDILALGDHKCMAVCNVEGGASRRLDLLLTPASEIAYATLYFTGSDTFNVAMRSWALGRGWSLNEHILTWVGTASGAGAPAPPPMASEEEIFRFLGLVYIPPTERTGPEKIIPTTIKIKRV
jgi:DNA polymerase beta